MTGLMEIALTKTGHSDLASITQMHIICIMSNYMRRLRRAAHTLLESPNVIVDPIAGNSSANSETSLTSLNDPTFTLSPPSRTFGSTFARNLDARGVLADFRPVYGQALANISDAADAWIVVSRSRSYSLQIVPGATLAPRSEYCANCVRLLSSMIFYHTYPKRQTISL